METKRCPKCKKYLSREHFYKSYWNESGSPCRSCNAVRLKTMRENYPERFVAAQRRYNIKQRYGIEEADYQRMIIEQEQCCAICGRHVLNQTKKNRLCIDHDHKTGKVRGLLCGGCNAHLAVLENKGFIKEAIRYLERTR